MPYFDHQMATSISDSTTSENFITKKKVVRTVACSNKNTEKNVSKEPDSIITSKYKQDLDLRKLMFMRNLLKIEIENLQKQKGALPSNNSENYQKYSYNTKKILLKGKNSIFYEAQNSNYPKQTLCCRFYDAKVGINPDSLYLKILQHLGKKHNSLIQTWDLFVNGDGNLEIFQEYCSIGNMEQFVQNNSLNEKQISLYAWQLLKGLDFLGDIGISHRDIQPRNLVLKPAQKDNFLKITNFCKAIIYWSVSDNDVIYVPCEPKEDQAKHGENYQAPEIYGDSNTEEFDPIIADTWSYGAVIYYMASKEYPYKVVRKSDDLEQEIEDNVDKLTLSSEGKDLLKSILRTDTTERIPIGLIEKNFWFADAKKTKIKALVNKNSKKPVNTKWGDFAKSKVFARPSEFESSASVNKKDKSKLSLSKKSSSRSKPRSRSRSRSRSGSKSIVSLSKSKVSVSKFKSKVTNGIEAIDGSSKKSGTLATLKAVESVKLNDPLNSIKKSLSISNKDKSESVKESDEQLNKSKVSISKSKVISTKSKSKNASDKIMSVEEDKDRSISGVSSSAKDSKSDSIVSGKDNVIELKNGTSTSENDQLDITLSDKKNINDSKSKISASKRDEKSDMATSSNQPGTNNKDKSETGQKSPISGAKSNKSNKSMLQSKISSPKSKSRTVYDVILSNKNSSESKNETYISEKDKKSGATLYKSSECETRNRDKSEIGKLESPKLKETSNKFKSMSKFKTETSMHKSKALSFKSNLRTVADSTMSDRNGFIDTLAGTLEFEKDSKTDASMLSTEFATNNKDESDFSKEPSMSETESTEIGKYVFKFKTVSAKPKPKAGTSSLLKSQSSKLKSEVTIPKSKAISKSPNSPLLKKT